MLNSFFAITVIYVYFGKFRILSKIRINELRQKASGGGSKLLEVLETKNLIFTLKWQATEAFWSEDKSLWLLFWEQSVGEARKEAWGPVRRWGQKSRQEKIMMVWTMMVVVHICCQILDIFFKVAFMILFWSTWTLRVRRLIKGNCKEVFFFFFFLGSSK